MALFFAIYGCKYCVKSSLRYGVCGCFFALHTNTWFSCAVIYLWSKFLLYFPCHRCIHSRPYQWIIVSKFGSVWKLITTLEIGMKMNFELWTQFFDSKYHFWWCFRYRWSNGFQFLKNFRWFYYVMYDHRFPNHTICHRSIPQMMRTYLAFYPTNIQWLSARFLFR